MKRNKFILDCVRSTTTRSPCITDGIDSIISVVLRWKDNFATDEIQDVREENSTGLDPLYSEHEMHHHEVDVGAWASVPCSAGLQRQLMSRIQLTQRSAREEKVEAHRSFDFRHLSCTVFELPGRSCTLHV